MIKNPKESIIKNKYRVLIYGVPGIAKSTTALSAPSPLIIDTDRGLDRVPAKFRRGDFIQPDNYEEIITDLQPENVRRYETLVFDTGGALLNLMKAWAIQRNPTNGQKDGITLSMRGYGAVGQEFQRLMDHCYYALGKHVVVVFHAKEEMDGDIKVFRLDVEGQTRNNIWKCVDIGGFMEAIRDKRIIGFSPTDRYFAKGTHGIGDIMEIPNVVKGAANDFLTTLFARINQNLKEEMQLVVEYDKLMASIKNSIETVQNVETANNVFSEIKTLNHIFASKVEAWYLLKTRAESCGLVYNHDKFEVKVEAKAS
jgi:hypothetical protein